jgi:hypothetical protein
MFPWEPQSYGFFLWADLHKKSMGLLKNQQTLMGTLGKSMGLLKNQQTLLGTLGKSMGFLKSQQILLGTSKSQWEIMKVSKNTKSLGTIKIRWEIIKIH